MSGNTNLENTAAAGISEAGQAALDAVKAKFEDTTVDESILGFGDKFCDWRAPLAQVAIVYAADNPEDPTKKYKDEEGNEKTADELKEAAEGRHEPTPGKVEKLKKFYSELYPEEEEAGEGEGEGKPTTPTETPTEGDQPAAADPSNP